MEKRKSYLFLFTAGVCMFVFLAGLAYAGTAGLITKEELLKVLDDPELVVLDVRTGRDWKSSEFKIKGAVRANPGDFKSWISQHSKDKRYVTYCA